MQRIDLLDLPLDEQTAALKLVSIMAVSRLPLPRIERILSALARAESLKLLDPTGQYSSALQPTLQRSDRWWAAAVLMALHFYLDEARAEHVVAYLGQRHAPIEALLCVGIRAHAANSKSSEEGQAVQ